jgi:hypothetical protein
MVSRFLNDRTLNAGQLAKKTYGSYATAWEVMKKINLLFK